MAWFFVWLPLVSQLVVPVSLLAWLAFGRHATKARTLVVNALVATYVVAIGIAGLWLVIPWWLPFAYGVVVVWTIARRLRGKDVSTPRPPVVSWLAVTVLIGGLTMLRPGSTIAPLSGEPVPIRLGGRYLVRNDRVRADREGS